MRIGAGASLRTVGASAHGGRVPAALTGASPTRDWGRGSRCRGGLRRRVQLYDLAYDLAVTSPDRRKKLQGPDDLAQVQDSELIQACNAMGLVSDVGYKQLDMVRYMRNYASAAHSNQT